MFPTDLNTSRMPASVPLACSLSPCRPTACTNLRPACAFHITAKQNNLPTSPPKTQHMCTPSRHGRSWFIQHPFQSFSFTSMHDVDPGFRSQVVLEECCGDMGPGRLTAISTQFPPPSAQVPFRFFVCKTLLLTTILGPAAVMSVRCRTETEPRTCVWGYLNLTLHMLVNT